MPCLKKYRVLLFVVVCNLYTVYLYSQNLVPNPSFETTNPCPTSAAQLDRAAPWDLPTNHTGSSDFFHTCAGAGCMIHVPNNFFGVANAFHGNGYVGIITHHNNMDFHEYIQAPLNSPLTANGVYCVSLRVMRSSRSPKATNNIGVHFSNTAIGQAGMGALTAFVPQIEETTVITDSAKWTLISGQYTAIGGESYITIGNFRSNAATTTVNTGTPAHPCQPGQLSSYTYYYIDSVIVELCSLPPTAYFVTSDTSLCEDECISFTDTSQGIPTSWKWNFTGATPDTSILQHPSGICYPDAGTYTVSLIVENAYGVDTAYQVINVLTEFECNPDAAFYVPNSFTPDGDGVNDVFIPKFNNVVEEDYHLYIFDRWGNLIFNTTSTTTGWNGKANNGKDIAQVDTYVWKVKYKNIEGIIAEKTGHVNLIK